MPSQLNSSLNDSESQHFLEHLAREQAIKNQRVPSVRTVLVVLSSRGMVYDMESLRQKILLAYPDAAVFFRTTLGKPVGPDSPQTVDLLIDFTGPGQRQGWFYSRSLRRMARIAVGRNAGLFRKKIYDRVFDEKDLEKLDLLERERIVQRKVLELVGIPLVQSGDATLDRGKSIALELPPMQALK